MRLVALTTAIAALALGALTTAAHADTTGWNVLYEQDPSSALTHIRFVIRSGSLSDPSGKPGAAYYTARGMLRGTQTRPFQDLNTAIESLGAQISVSVGPTETVFDTSVMNANLDNFLNILSDFFTNPAFTVSDMNMLQTILFGELRDQLQSGQAVAQRALMQTAYAGTALANPFEGTVAGISALTPQDARSYFTAHYTRENMIIAVTGPTDEADLVSDIEQQLDSIPHGALDPTELPAPTGIQGKGIQAIVVDREGMNTVPVYVATGGVADSDPAMLGLEAGNFILGGGTSSRLYQALAVQNNWTAGVSSSYDDLLQPNSQPGLFSVYLYPANASFTSCMSEALSQLQSYVSQGITASELSFAQSSLGNSYPFQLDTAQDRLSWDVRSALTGRTELTAEQYSSALEQLSLASLNPEIASKTDAQDLLIVAVGSSSTLQPILSALPGVKSVNVVTVNP